MWEQLRLEEVQGTLVVLATQWGVRIIGAVLVLLAGWIVANWAARRVMALKEMQFDATLLPVMSSGVRIMILGLTMLTVLAQFGVPTTSLVAVIGASGLAIGLALQGTLSNVAAGIILLSLRPFQVGETIEVSGTRGVVDQIGLMVTHMHTFDNIFVSVPNSQIWGKEIRNYTRNPTRRIDMVFGISYSDDVSKAMAIISQVLSEDARILKEPAPLIAVGELADSSVNILARPWVNTGDYMAVDVDTKRKVKEAFDRAGISIPFPQRDVHLIQAAS